MSTKLTELADSWVVSTVYGPGKRRRMGRGAVRVPKGDKGALRAEIIRQAEAVRVIAGVRVKTQEPVV